MNDLHQIMLGNNGRWEKNNDLMAISQQCGRRTPCGDSFSLSRLSHTMSEISQSSRLDFLQHVYHQCVARKYFLAAPAFACQSSVWL
jgi:hypothetical protein